MSDPLSPDLSPVDRLRALMTRLRDRESGCPWDVEQDFSSVAPYTIEEAYEVADAIACGDMAGLRDELGDLLFQVVFHAEMAREAGLFDLDDVAREVTDKMIRRHPHVFGDAEIADAAEQTRAWEEHKAAEREAAAEAQGRRPSVLDGVTRGIPALSRAMKLQRRAARVGFDWARRADVLAKVREELDEIEAEMTETPSHARLEDELGDLLFAAVNLARVLDLDPEEALRRANAKFERRFRKVEDALGKKGKTPSESDLEEMDRIWEAVKRAESDASP
ncbi:MAG: nucleoside triphosphate pyrophosphohydrolase [Alphaproteobacteria bacterium]|nr:MAG: nucleoside triphosphate pyrophosphohydrolase [Alphaproteobacteria bacterium]